MSASAAGISSLPGWVADALRLFFPSRCMICRKRLVEGERQVCAACFHRLPFTGLHGRPGNVVERLFWEKVPVVRANAYLRYQQGAESRNLFFNLKYYDRPQVGRYFGRLMAADVVSYGFFEGIDCIIPLPLSRQRERRRGYNQSYELACGVADYTGLPVETQAVVRTVDNPSQTRKRSFERQENVRDIFSLRDAGRLSHRHVLLVDDILTTGATLLSCAREIAKAEDVRISILVLGLAGRHFRSGLRDVEP